MAATITTHEKHVAHDVLAGGRAGGLVGWLVGWLRNLVSHQHQERNPQCHIDFPEETPYTVIGTRLHRDHYR